MKDSPNAAFGRSYLAGFARAYRRGNVTLSAVKGGAKVAQRCGIGDDEIVTLLRDFDLTFDRTTGTVTDDWSVSA